MGGGCREHTPTLYLSDYMYASDPPGVDLWIHDGGEPDPCLALLYRRFSIALDQLRPAYPAGFVLINRHPDNGGGALRVALPIP